MPTKQPPPKPGNPQSKARPLPPPPGKPAGAAPPPARGATLRPPGRKPEATNLSTQVLRPDEASRPSRVDIRAQTHFEDGAATQLSTPETVEEVRRSLAAARARTGNKAVPAAPAESDATMLGGPSFVEEVRAQLAAAGVTAPDEDDEDSFAPESGIRERVEFTEDQEPLPERDDPLSDPVIAAILAADEPAPRRGAPPPPPPARSGIQKKADDMWGPVFTDHDGGAPPTPPQARRPAPKDQPAHTVLEEAPDLDLPPAPSMDDDFQVDFLDEPDEPAPPPRVAAKPAPRPAVAAPAPRPAVPKTRLTPTPPPAKTPPPPVAKAAGSGPKARPFADSSLPDVLKPAGVTPPLRTHRVGTAAGKLLLAVPEGARVSVERQAAGAGSVLLVGMEPQARVAVEVAVDGYTPWRSMVSLGGKPTGQVKVELRKIGR